MADPCWVRHWDRDPPLAGRPALTPVDETQVYMLSSALHWTAGVTGYPHLTPKRVVFGTLWLASRFPSHQPQAERLSSACSWESTGATAGGQRGAACRPLSSQGAVLPGGLYSTCRRGGRPGSWAGIPWERHVVWSWRWLSATPAGRACAPGRHGSRHRPPEHATQGGSRCPSGQDPATHQQPRRGPSRRW